MNRRTFLSFAGALAAAAALASAAVASSGPAVTVKVRAPNKTLLSPTSVHGGKGWITKGGTPRGKCSAASAAGALNNATHSKWDGKYYSSVGGIFITSILGYKPKGSHYWEVFVNGHSSSKGICAIKLVRGERLLFKVH
jgi:hypothetical protein